VVLGSFIHILLSVLLLPFSLLEASLAALIALAAMSWGLAVSMPYEINGAYVSQLFVISTTAILILTISHLSNVLRRRAFHAAFDLALQAARMQEMSATDPLTGGYNRRYIENLLNLEMARAGRFGHSLSLLMFDLDNFKPVNDSLGHSAGDEVLRQVWRSAAVALREVDTLSRFGGDEFLIVLPETGTGAARQIADRLRSVVSHQLRDKWGPDSLEGRVTLSIGVLTLEGRDFLEVKTALARVDELLYDAKRGGKNRMAVG
jgi:diguanylate cyclase (GGDEF)-like protein